MLCVVGSRSSPDKIAPILTFALSCPIGSLAGQLAERDPKARAAIAAGFDRWEAHIRAGLSRMKARGKLRKDADLTALATATMASIQGGLLLTQVHRDPQQLRIALNAARKNLKEVNMT